MSKPWITTEVRFVCDNYESMSAKEIAERLGRSVGAIYGCVSAVNKRELLLNGKRLIKQKCERRPSKFWKTSEVRQLRELHKTHSNSEIAKILDRQEGSIAYKMRAEGITTYGWTIEKDALLLEYRSQGYPILKIAEMMDLSYGNVWRRLNKITKGTGIVGDALIQAIHARRNPSDGDTHAHPVA